MISDRLIRQIVVLVHSKILILLLVLVLLKTLIVLLLVVSLLLEITLLLILLGLTIAILVLVSLEVGVVLILVVTITRAGQEKVVHIASVLDLRLSTLRCVNFCISATNCSDRRTFLDVLRHCLGVITPKRALIPFC